MHRDRRPAARGILLAVTGGVGAIVAAIGLQFGLNSANAQSANGTTPVRTQTPPEQQAPERARRTGERPGGRDCSKDGSGSFGSDSGSGSDDGSGGSVAPQGQEQSAPGPAPLTPEV